MSRRLKLATKELGTIELFVIYSTDGAWEHDWLPLQGSGVSELFATISKETYDHALVGWTKPLITSLGIGPKGSIRKLPVVAKHCAVRAKCPFFDKKTCHPDSRNLPWCYEPDVSEDEDQRRMAAEIVRLWREGVYVIVVQEIS